MLEAGFLSGITRLSGEIGSDKHRKDDDIADRFNHAYTTIILMFCTLISLSRQYIGKPLACWTPTEFTSAQEQYVESMCWINSTYYIPHRVLTITRNLTERHSNTLLYYQWIPFILMFQAALFALPCIFWRMFNWQSRIHLWTIMDLAMKSQTINENVEFQNDQLFFIVRHLEDALFMRHRKHFQNYYKKRRADRLAARGDRDEKMITRPVSMIESFQASPDAPPDQNVYGPILSEIKDKNHLKSKGFSSKSSSYLMILYIITKALYLFNSVGQIFFMQRYLNTKSLFFGFWILYKGLWTGEDWSETGAFPRVTLCDLDLRKLGSNLHTLTVQCVLSGNMFNEKIYVFLWFWINSVTLINIFSFLKWSYRCSFETSRIEFIKGLLVERRSIHISTLKNHSDVTTGDTSKDATKTILNKNSVNLKTPSPLPEPLHNGTHQVFQDTTIPLSITKDSDKKLAKIFTEYVLGQDGVLVIRFISLNVSRTTAGRVVEIIWNRFRAKYTNKLTAPGTASCIPEVPNRRMRSSTPTSCTNEVGFRHHQQTLSPDSKLHIDDNHLIKRRAGKFFRALPIPGAQTTTTMSSTSSENLMSASDAI